ncbi:hypothetical protein [Actinomadura flavalba]|uniref:hypothetical protein n=1 Tax=Actinomadura flavalba TaxID=1120938 RepID=UPI0003733542|nr:hypothetical protein [Actinomadura flavalba]
MGAEMPAWGELTAQLLSLVEARLVDPLEILLEDDLATVRSRLAARAGTWAQRLLGDDGPAAALTAARLVAALYPGDGPFDPPAAWWATPLGRVVAWRVGHPGAEAVSYAVAGAMLGVTRQGVHDLVTRGKLARHPSGGVTTASVRDRIDQRAGAALRTRRREAGHAPER